MPEKKEFTLEEGVSEGCLWGTRGMLVDGVFEGVLVGCQRGMREGGLVNHYHIQCL